MNDIEEEIKVCSRCGEVCNDKWSNLCLVCGNTDARFMTVRDAQELSKKYVNSQKLVSNEDIKSRGTYKRVKEKYKIQVSIDEKNFFWVVIESGKIISKNSSMEELSKIDKTKYYNDTNICPRCREENNITDKSILYPRNVCHEKDKDGNETGELVCLKHWSRNYQKYDPNSWDNIRKKITNRRTNNQDPTHACTKGDLTIDIVCKLRDWENLNEIYDKYNTVIDCRNKKTGSLHQVQGRSLNILRIYTTTKGEERYNEGWILSSLKKEWKKKYKSMIFVCKSKDEKTVEEMYEFPSNVIEGKTNITITKNPKRVRKGDRWYDQYRVNEEEINKINDILQKNN